MVVATASDGARQAIATTDLPCAEYLYRAGYHSVRLRSLRCSQARTSGKSILLIEKPCQREHSSLLGGFKLRPYQGEHFFAGAVKKEMPARQ